jgi:hypothetical protein
MSNAGSWWGNSSGGFHYFRVNRDLAAIFHDVQAKACDYNCQGLYYIGLVYLALVDNPLWPRGQKFNVGQSQVYQPNME